MGVAKRMACHIWREEKNLVPGQSEAYITKRHLLEMKTAALTSFVLPLGYDGQAIPRKIHSGKIGFSGMKSDEFRTWILALSPYLLSMRLKPDLYNHWMHFVKASAILASTTVSLEEVEKMNWHMNEFVKNFSKLYLAPQLMSINTHLLLHQKENLESFGPGHASWIFNFERYNCDIKNIRTNRKGNYELTYLKKFMQMVHAGDYFESLYHQSVLGEDSVLLDNLVSKERNIANQPESLDFFLPAYIALNHGHKLARGYEPLPISASKFMLKSESCMNIEDFLILLQYYQVTYSGQIFTINNTPRTIWTFNNLNLFGNIYRSMDSSSANSRGSYIRAFYRLDSQERLEHDGETEDNRVLRHYHVISTNGNLRPAQIMYFFKHQVNLIDQSGQMRNMTHTFAFVRWLLPSRTNLLSYSHGNMQVWSNEFEEPSAMSILPVHLIYSPIAVKLQHLDNINVITTLVPKIHI
ncbi:hypothetical protein INT47_001838 [Mucor saturninus]|uniref:Uncharacterized protein n=2 Tax=Mucor saturninus TaxID=64648 RepID=A0A8H7V8R5_9FUNG|nr:hypothetical protein INT47_001838 [Mucor saturninus]